MISAMLLFGNAWATTYTVDVCAELTTNFVDAGGSNGDDYILTNRQKAIGAHIRVARLDGTPLPIPITIADYWAGTSGTGAGCIPITLALDSTKTYRVSVYSEALVNGQTIEVYDDSTTPALTKDSTDFSPTASGTKTVYTTGNYPDWNVLAAGSYAVWRDDLGNANGTITAYSEACSGGWSCFTGTAVYISPSAGYTFKYQTAHEFGHAMLYGRYGGSAANVTAAPDGCLGDPTDTTGINGHHFISKEYQGDAFWEGFANYYATAAFNNNTTETDCSFGLYKAVDWDRDGDTERAQFIDCVADPLIDDFEGADFTVNGEEYVDNFCDAGSAECFLHANCNRGTEFQWVQFLWKLDTAEAMGPEPFGDIYADAHLNGGGYASTGNGYGSGYPAHELLQAAIRLNSATWGADWNTWDGVYAVGQFH